MTPRLSAPDLDSMLRRLTALSAELEIMAERINSRRLEIARLTSAMATDARHYLAAIDELNAMNASISRHIASKGK